jgi:hypothetical protein
MVIVGRRVMVVNKSVIAIGAIGYSIAASAIYIRALHVNARTANNIPALSKASAPAKADHPGSIALRHKMPFAMEVAMDAQSGPFNFTHPATVVTGNCPVAFMSYMARRLVMGGMHVMMFRAAGVVLRTVPSVVLSVYHVVMVLSAYWPGMMISASGIVRGPCIA